MQNLVIYLFLTFMLKILPKVYISLEWPMCSEVKLLKIGFKKNRKRTNKKKEIKCLRHKKKHTQKYVVGFVFVVVVVVVFNTPLKIALN